MIRSGVVYDILSYLKPLKSPQTLMLQYFEKPKRIYQIQSAVYSVVHKKEGALCPLFPFLGTSS